MNNLHVNQESLPATINFSDSQVSDKDLALFPVSRKVVNPILLIRPRPVEGQCRQDYYMCLAKKNRLGGVRQLSSIIGLTFHEMMSVEMSTFLRFIDGDILGPQNLITSDTKYTLTKLMKMGRVKMSRICPECLVEENPVKDDFIYPLTIKCSIHDLLLVDCCPKCDRGLTYLRKKIDFCDCGFDLKHSQPISAPPWVGEFYRLFAPWRFSSEGTPLNPENRKREIFSCKLLRTLIEAMSLSGGNHYQNYWVSSNDYIEIESLVSLLPYSFEAIYFWQLNLASTVVVKNLEMLLEDNGLPILESMAKSALEKWEFKSLVTNQSCIPTRFSISSYFFVSRYRFVTKIDGGFPRYHSFKENIHKSIYVQESEFRRNVASSFDLTLFVEFVEETIDVSESANILFCSEEYIFGLMHLSLLPCYVISANNIPRMLMSDIEEFWRILVRRSLPLPRKPMVIIRLSDIQPLSDGEQVSDQWEQLFKCVMEEDVPLYRLNEVGIGLKSLGVAVSDVNRFESEHQVTINVSY